MIAPREEVLCGKVRKIVIFYKKKKNIYFALPPPQFGPLLPVKLLG